MRSKRRIIIYLLLLSMFSEGILLSQDYSAYPDTSDYLPLFMNGALEYNLMVACEKGYPAEVQRMINSGAEIEASTEEGATPLVIAVANNNPIVTEILLQNGAFTDHYTATSETPLIIAVKNGNSEITEILLRYGADINIKDRYGSGPLLYASLYGYYVIADMLLYYEADEDLKARDGTTPLMAAIWSGNADIAELLISHGANMEARDDDGFTPYIIAAQTGDTTTMNLLYSKGVDIYETNNYGFDALGIAIRADMITGVKHAIRLKHTEKVTPHSGIDPYEIAAVYRRNHLVKILDDYNTGTIYRKSLNQLLFKPSSRFNNVDVFTGFGLATRESSSGWGIQGGVDTKLWYTKVYKKIDDNLYYQYRDKSTFAYAGLFKEILLKENSGGKSLLAFGSVSAGYYFGKKYPGTNKSAEKGVKIMPETGLKYEAERLGFELGISYFNGAFDLQPPLWLRAGIYYKFVFNKVGSPLKEIRWY